MTAIYPPRPVGAPRQGGDYRFIPALAGCPLLRCLTGVAVGRDGLPLRWVYQFIYLLCLFLFSITLKTAAQPNNLQKADSLFAVGQYESAKKRYENQLLQTANNNLIPLSLYYKLAFISEKQNDYAHTLYYLSIIYSRKPQQIVLNKLKEIAATHQLEGYDSDDFSFVFLFFRRYSLYFTLFLFLVAIYVFGVLVYKRSQKQPIPNLHKWVVSAYLLSLLGLLNLPDSYRIAIVSQDRTHLRAAPSSAAPVEEAIAKGNKVTIIGENDQWLRIWQNRKSLYVRKLDVWIVR